MLFGGLHGGGVDGGGDQRHSVGLGLAPFGCGKKREKPEVQNIFDTLGLEECVVWFVFGFRSPVNAIVDLPKSNDGGPRSRVYAAEIRTIGFPWRMDGRAAPAGNKRQKHEGKNSHQQWRTAVSKLSKARQDVSILDNGPKRS